METPGIIRLAIGIVLAFMLTSAAQEPATQQKLAAANTEDWVLRLDGIGPVKVGMSLAQLNRALQEKLKTPTDREEQSCFYVSSPRHQATLFMIEDGRVSRVDVVRRGIYTEKGIQVGDSEQQVLKVYGKALKVEDNAYSADRGDHSLTMHSGAYGLRFETIGGKVRSFHSGRFRSVQYIEGCL